MVCCGVIFGTKQWQAHLRHVTEHTGHNYTTFGKEVVPGKYRALLKTNQELLEAGVGPYRTPLATPHTDSEQRLSSLHHITVEGGSPGRSVGSGHNGGW
jgi:hypothetical protein